ncbi:MAG: hypothetical protein BMS9Abin37_1769 [Acidobacteriota bacterium]|nr:MAG: hypothetical protein BMS9Abin37_1769 [Acidobacteriota bacterium]
MAGSNNDSGRERPTYEGRAVPECVAELFWDAPSRPLELALHESLLVRRVINVGSWSACQWLRNTLGDRTIEKRLRQSRGRGVERRALRLWQVLLDLPESQVGSWLSAPERRVWDGRTS